MLIFHSINSGFDAKVTKKFLNGVYYSLAETEPWRNRWTFMDGFTVTTLLMLNCQSGCIFFWKTDLAITILPKPSRKIEPVNKVFLFWYWKRLKKYFFRNKTFLFFKIERWNFQNQFENLTNRETSQSFNSIRQPIEKMEVTIVWIS